MFLLVLRPPLSSRLCPTSPLTVQILLARQAVRTRRRLTRKTVKHHLMESRRFLRTLRLLAKEVAKLPQCWDLVDVWVQDLLISQKRVCDSSFQPQSTIPDVFLWLLRGTKRLAYVRVPAHSILFSLVEEQRGRNCGRVTTLYIKVEDP